MGDMLVGVPGLRVTEGNAGLGSVGTKLNVATRGVDPRFSSRTTVLLDGVPIATAPYGRPQLTLFPISPFSIERIDVIRGGASVRFGPQTAGGIIDLVSRPIPESLTVIASSQVDQFGGTRHGAAVGGTRGRWGASLEVTPRVGRDFREHSAFHSEGGLLKLRYAPGPRLVLRSLSHAHWEHVQIPGGLRPEDAAADPRQSTRTRDAFIGWRVGTNAVADARIGAHHQLRMLGYAHRTDRISFIARGHDDEEPALDEQPRTFDVAAVEPRWVTTIDRGAGPRMAVTVGVRGAYERGHLRGTRDGRSTRDTHVRLGAVAAYAEQSARWADVGVTVNAGVRSEQVSVLREDRREGQRGRRRYAALLPAASIAWDPVPSLRLFAAYRRSFGPPQFLQISLAQEHRQLRPETADTVDAGIELNGAGGVRLAVTGWVKAFDDLIDVSLDAIETPGDTVAQGVEVEGRWIPSAIVPALRGLELSGAHALTRGRITTGPLAGRPLPWFPRHEVWGALTHQSRRGLLGGLRIHYVGARWTDYAASEEEDATGRVGRLPAHALVHAHLGLRRRLASGTTVTLVGGVRNVLDARWSSRSDDRNGGVLPMAPRTLYVQLTLRHRI